MRTFAEERQVVVGKDRGFSFDFVFGEETPQDKILRQSRNLQDQVPESWSMKGVKSTMEARSDPDPLKTVLFQEIDRYNSLLGMVKQMIKQTEEPIQANGQADGDMS